MKKLLIFLIFSVTIAVFVFAAEQQKGNTEINSFSKSKKFLDKVIYGDEKARKTFYCGCSYDRKQKVIAEGCSYFDAKNHSRSRRVEWEHIVPAAAFGGKLKEWKEGDPQCVDSRGKRFKGRNCASKMNKQFQFMQADMYNLVPAIGKVNADRSNFDYGEIPGEERAYGNCDFEVKNNTAEPRESIRGDIARAYFYMDSAYPGFGIVNDKNRKMLETWDKADPVDEWECKRAAEIEKIQKNQNLILKERCNKRI